MQILGALLLGSGLLAAAGSKKRNSNYMTASLTISLLGMLLAFEFVTEVSPCYVAHKKKACNHKSPKHAFWVRALLFSHHTHFPACNMAAYSAFAA